MPSPTSFVTRMTCPRKEDTASTSSSTRLLTCPAAALYSFVVNSQFVSHSVRQSTNTTGILAALVQLLRLSDQRIRLLAGFPRESRVKPFCWCSSVRSLISSSRCGRSRCKPRAGSDASPASPRRSFCRCARRLLPEPPWRLASFSLLLAVYSLLYSFAASHVLVFLLQ